MSLSVMTRALTLSGKAPLNESLSVLYDRPRHIKVVDGVLLPRPLLEPPLPLEFPCPLSFWLRLCSAKLTLNALPSSSEPSSSNPF